MTTSDTHPDITASDSDELRALFSRHQYVSYMYYPWKKLNLARISLFTDDRPDLEYSAARRIVVALLYSPVELVNRIRFWAGRRPILNFSLSPEFYLRSIGRTRPTTRTLLDLFFYCRSITVQVFNEALRPEECALLERAGLIQIEEGRIQPCYRVLWHNGFLFLEPTATRSILDASYKVAWEVERWLPKQDGATRMLDVGSGTGFHTVLFAEGFTEVIALDIDPVALDNTRLNARLNSCENVKFVQSDMYQNTQGTFDLIVANPPPLFVPPGQRKVEENTRFFDGGDFGIELALQIIEGFDEHLAEGGLAVMSLISSVVNGEDLALSAITTQFQGKGYSIEATVVSDIIESEFQQFYSEQGITRRPRMVLSFHRNGIDAFKCHQLPFVKRCMFAFQRALARV